MNRLKIMVLVSCVIIMAKTHAITVQENFLQGNEWYARGAYDKALSVYQSIDQKGPGVWYNMGNAAFLLGDYSHALVYWYRAYPGARTELSRVLYENRQQVYQQGTQRVQRYAIWYDTLHPFYAKFSVLFLQRLVGILWIIALIVLIGMWCQRVSKVSNIFIGLWLLIWCFSVVGLVFSYYTTVQPIAIVMTETTVHEGPADWYAPLFTINKTDEVIYLRKYDDWAKILTHNGAGWVSEKTIERIHE